ncbi:hypothetical protein GUJ93_ZPchr0012g19337 [Zizania palustris]|uniref:Uncharacterized protein n=2 Tax=Zizania palustris TaxID=103762 RepID=A0A8J5WJ39_ZIZPA|nr:hypothetical protein GUJ93_ZPchr0012g19337 [Zizania palustris]
MKKLSCHGRTATYDHEHSLSKITGEAMKHQQGNIAGAQAAKNKSWKKRYLTFLSKFQNKMKHKKPDGMKAAGGGSKQRRSPKRGLLLSSQILEECSNLVQVIRQTTAGCFAAAATAVAASVSYEDDQPPYMQLDQVSYGVKRDAFGPVYLVT